jgi:hypothetical protein
MEAQYLAPGAPVDVDAAFGESLRRRVVTVENGRVYICTDDEYQAASQADRSPTCVGFRPEAVRLVSADP